MEWQEPAIYIRFRSDCTDSWQESCRGYQQTCQQMSHVAGRQDSGSGHQQPFTAHVARCRPARVLQWISTNLSADVARRQPAGGWQLTSVTFSADVSCPRAAGVWQWTSATFTADVACCRPAG
eukprot:jgi/Botrbrau1/13102/Bobra.0187s0060.1